MRVQRSVMPVRIGLAFEWRLRGRGEADRREGHRDDVAAVAMRVGGLFLDRLEESGGRQHRDQRVAVVRAGGAIEVRDVVRGEYAPAGREAMLREQHADV